MMILMTMHDEHAAILFKILQGLASLHRSVKQRVKIADDHHDKTEKGRLIGANRSPPVVQGSFEENERHENDNWKIRGRVIWSRELKVSDRLSCEARSR